MPPVIKCSRRDLPSHVHYSVKAARECAAARWAGRPDKPTEKMLAYVERLGGDRTKAVGMTFKECSQYIDNIKAGASGSVGMANVTLPGMASGAERQLKMPTALVKDIPEGYYAFKRDDGDFDFWRVGVKREKDVILAWRLQIVPKRSKPRDVIKMREVLLIVCKSSGDWVSMVTHRKDEINATLKRILIEGDKAKIAFGKATGRCGECGIVLEDEISVSLGIGPICRKKKPHLLGE